jgi:hypothetical protein
MSVSINPNTIELKFGGTPVGTFNYAVSGDQMLIFSGTDIGMTISLLAPLEKMTDNIAGPGQVMVFDFDLISGGANNGTYRLRSVNQWALGDAVIIPGIYEGKPVTEIGSTDDYYSGAFGGANIRAVYIPSSVRSIGDYTFSGCENLENITFGAGSKLQTIGSYAFSGCGDLASVAIPSGVTAIGDYAFYDCDSLDDITIPADVTAVGEYAFSGWTSSQKIYVMGYTSEAEADAAWGEYWRGGCEAVIVYPDHVHHWGDGWKVTTPPTCTTGGEETRICVLDPSHIETQPLPINTDAHVWNEVPEIIPPTCTEEGEETYVCKLCGEKSNATILHPLGHDYGAWTLTPPTCTTAGVNTRTCTRDQFTETLLGFPIDPDAHQWEWGSTATVTTDGVEGDICVHNSSHTRNTVHAYATGTPGLDYELIYEFSGGSNSGSNSDPNSSANNSAWRVRKGTVSSGEVYIPAYHRQDAQSPYLPITEIGSASDDFYQNNGAFYGTNITAITIPAGVTSIGASAFYNCYNLASIDIPASVTSIGDYAFNYCINLTGITIPANVTSIGTAAFNYCINLTDITIPASVTFIGGRAFRETAWLKSQPDGLVYINKILYVYKGTMPANTVITDIRTDTVAIAGNAFYNTYNDNTYNGNTSGLVSVTIPDGVTSIGNSAFEQCSGLTDITIPDSVTSIGDRAFINCINLTAVTLSSSVMSIGNLAFANCTSLTSITIPAGVTAVGNSAFDSWISSQTINVAGHASQASADAAWGTSWRGIFCGAAINYLRQ